MSLPLLITQKLPTTKNKQPVIYEKDACVYNCQAYARTPRAKFTKACNTMNVSKNNGKRRRKKCNNRNKTKQQNTNQSDKYPQALNIFSITTVEKVHKARKARSQCQNSNRNHDYRRLTSSPSPTLTYCPVRNVAACSTGVIHKPKLRSNSWLREKTASDSKIKCSMPEIRTKRQSCPPRLMVKSRQKNDIRIQKVYFSEAHSQLISGVPCAPPASPVSDVMIAVKIIPSMADCKSQQTIKTRLRNLEITRNKQEERLKEQVEKDERRRVKEEQEFLRQRRRTEIYALNSVMTQLERKKFLKFIEDREIGTQQTISLNV